MAVSIILGRACRKNVNILGSVKRWYTIEPPESISGPKLRQLGVPDDLLKNPQTFEEKNAGMSDNVLKRQLFNFEIY